MVSCDNWSPSLTFTVTPAFVQGDYLIKLTGPGNRQSYVPLTITDPASTATYVVKNDAVEPGQDRVRVVEYVDFCSIQGWSVVAARHLHAFAREPHLIRSTAFPARERPRTQLAR